MNQVRFLLLALAVAVPGIAATPRQVTSLDSDWRFHRGDPPDVLQNQPTNQNLVPAADFLTSAYDDSAWQKVTTPHDYIAEGTFDEKAENQHTNLPVEPAWYRKTIAIPASD